MIKLRQILLVAALLFAQLVAGAHAVEHVAGNEQGLPATHVCELCLAAHDLGAGLPVHAVLPPAVEAKPPLESISVIGRSAFPPPLARQGAPPRF